jgi:hypothetical protein
VPGLVWGFHLQVANTHTLDISRVPRLQKVFPHLDATPRPSIRVMNKQEVDALEFKLVCIMGLELLEGGCYLTWDTRGASRHDLSG